MSILAILSILLFSLFHISSSQLYNAIFNFGDSLSDTGNFFFAGFPFTKLPYGMTYFNHATGRCSDGRLVVDFIAEEVGLPYVPPSSAKDQSFIHGANFAYTSATSLDFDFFYKRNLTWSIFVNVTLDKQIDSFQQLLPSLCDTDCDDYLGNSLFIVGEIGGDDYNGAILIGRNLSEVYTFVPHVIHSISKAVQKLIWQGAIDIVVPGLLPMGCFPIYLTFNQGSNKKDYTRNGCLKKFNNFAAYHNSKLQQALEELQFEYLWTNIIYGDYFTPVIDFISKPQKYGFSGEGALRTCCGASGDGDYNFNKSTICGQAGATVCSDPTKYVSWDGIHLTDSAYHLIAKGWLYGPYASPPIFS